MNSREKIHEFVNMARHPEAKDLAEALNEEKSHKDCLIQLDCDKSIMTMEIFLLKWQDHQSKWGACELLPHKILGRPITAFDVCWALNKKTGEFDFSIERKGISFSRVCTIEADGNLVSCMPSLQGSKKGIFSFKTIEEDGTHTTLDQWGSKICNNLAILMYSNEEIIEIAKFKPKVN